VLPAGTGVIPYPMTITPDGLHAYWSNKADGNIAQCSFTAGGALDCRAGLIGAGTQPQYIAVDPFNHYVYAVNYNGGGAGSVSQYTIGIGGVLSSNSVAPIAATGNGPFSIATSK
jgi:6-phosphogluconolactonase (cycloisomerase 2 family)